MKIDRNGGTVTAPLVLNPVLDINKYFDLRRNRLLLFDYIRNKSKVQRWNLLSLEVFLSLQGDTENMPNFDLFTSY